MIVARPRPTFSASQLEELLRLGVVDQQLTELIRVIPLCGTMLRDDARLQDVRSELVTLRDALHSAERALARFTAVSPAQADEATIRAVRMAPINHPGFVITNAAPAALAEATTRVQMASIDSDGDGDDIERCAATVIRLKTIVARAVAELPTAQRRSRRASWLPVRRIYDALVLGWGKAHAVFDRDDADSVDLTQMPPFPHGPSSTVGSPFRVIVGHCYDLAQDTIGSDPERAIKSFIRERRKDAGREDQPS